MIPARTTTFLLRRSSGAALSSKMPLHRSSQRSATKPLTSPTFRPMNSSVMKGRFGRLVAATWFGHPVVEVGQHHPWPVPTDQGSQFCRDDAGTQAAPL